MNPGAYLFEASDFPDANQVVAELRKNFGNTEIFMIGGNQIDGVHRVENGEDAVDALARRGLDHLPIGVISPTPRDDLLEIANEGNLMGLCFTKTIKANLSTWTRHVIELLPFVARSHSLEGLAGSCRGRTGVIIGPGPSLSELDDRELRRICTGTVSIALNSAMGYLHDRGARPKIALGIEANEVAFPHRELLADDGIVCAYGPHCHPVWPDEAKGPILYVSQRAWPTAASLCDHLALPGIDSGGSVSTIAYQLLRYLGCSQIVLIGVDNRLGDDLAYDCTGRSVTVADDQLAETETFEGAKVRTLGILEMYRKWFERRAKSAPKIDHRVISPKVAKIEGFKIGRPTLSGDAGIVQRIAASPEIGKESIMEWVRNQHVALTKRAEHYRVMLDSIRRSIGTMATIREQTKSTGPSMADDCYALSVEEKLVASSYSSVYRMEEIVKNSLSSAEFLRDRLYMIG